MPGRPLLTSQAVAMTAFFIVVQEEVRKPISRELHDEVFPHLLPGPRRTPTAPDPYDHLRRLRGHARATIVTVNIIRVDGVIRLESRTTAVHFTSERSFSP